MFNRAEVASPRGLVQALGIMLTVFLSLVVSLAASTASVPTREVCVAQFDSSAGRRDPNAFSGWSHFPEVWVDFGIGQIAAVRPDGAVITYLRVRKTHRVALLGNRGKVISTFTFSFEEHGLRAMCIWYNPRRHNWTLSELTSAPRKFCESCDPGK